MSKIITEITPLSDKDFFYFVDRTKDQFTFPIHRHDEFELNFISNCEGARRIVGDSIEDLGKYDLCLIGHGIEHTWEQHNCTSKNIREVTIQFSKDFLESKLMQKNQLSDIRRMLEKSSKGIAFSMNAIMKVYSHIEKMLSLDSGFYRIIEFLTILHELAISDDSHSLASSSFNNVKTSSDSRRVQKAQDFVMSHYKEEIRLAELARIAGMTETSFSRFFKLRTGRSLSEYVTDIRLGHATRALMESTMSVAEISYDCGFNNISNFNRIFKKKKGCTPKEFRDLYHRHQVIT